MLSLYYDELMGKVKEHERKKYLVIDDYMLDNVLDKVKEIIGIEKFADIKVLIDKDDKMPDDGIFKNVVTCVIKDNDKFYLQLFLEEALFDR